MKKILIFILLISLCLNIDKERKAGVLMHISSLPSNYGIGTLGAEAYHFVDFLVNAKQRIWEILPIGPTLFGDSPYQSFSTFAGNPYFVDLDALIQEGLLTEGEVKGLYWGDNDPTRIDYSLLFKQRFEVLYKAYQRFKPLNEFYFFINMNKDWVEDYALFMALKKHFNYKPWTEWPEGLKLHRESDLKPYRVRLQYEIRFYLFIEFKFQEQLKKLRDHAFFKRVQIIGEVPFYPPLDSADVWANQDLFQIDKNGNLLAKAGAPPDSFNSEGQIWGNPLYNWEKMVRIDHFIGLESYWSIPPDETDARNGKWIKGPDKDFIDVLHKNLGYVQFIAGDLGYPSPEVKELLEYSHFTGSKVLQYAFDSREPADYFPHTYSPDSVCYTGMHDHNPLAGWQKELAYERAGLASVSKIFIAQMQDYLHLEEGARMNKPGTRGGNNWKWRVKREQINNDLAWSMQEMSELYGRYEFPTFK